MYAGQDVNLIVNVYGFSRGATAARHFLHIATNPAETLVVFKNEGVAKAPYDIPDRRIKINIDNPMLQYGYFGACLLENEVEPKSIKFNFVGLYDTVASFGINHRGGLGGIIGDDTKQLGLSAVNKSYFVLQIASDDEYRDNFDLTNINSCGLYGLELTLPGVHSDIGGSYLDGAKEISVLYCKPYETPNSWAFEGEKIQIESEKFKEILIKEGWYSEDQLEIKKFWQSDVENKSILDKALVGMYLKGLVGTKQFVRNTYDKIPLNIMFHYSKQFGVKYLDYKLTDNYAIDDSFIENINSQLWNYINNCNAKRNQYVEEFKKGSHPSAKQYMDEIKGISYLDYIQEEDLKKLRKEYLHWSVKTNKMGLNIKGQKHDPSVEGAVGAKYRKRHIQDG